MPDVSKKITRMFERGFDFFKDKGRFRHVKGYQLRLQDPSNHPSAKYAHEVAQKLECEFDKYGFPRTTKEFRRYCQETYQDVAPAMVSSNPTISARNVARSLSDPSRSRIVSLSEYPDEEPYFTKVLTDDQLKKSLHLVNNLDMNKIPAVISVLDQACKAGVPVENVIEEIKSDEDVRMTVDIRERFCPI